MIGIFDRYLFLSFMRVWLIAFFSFSGLYIVIDLFNNLEEFIQNAEMAGGLVPVLCEYYGPRLLTLGDRTSGLLSLMATLFVLSWLQRTNEFTAVEAAGVSPLRAIRSLIVAAVLVSVLAFLNRELWIPRYQELLSRTPREWRAESSRRMVPRYDNQTDVYLQGKAVVIAEKRVEGPVFRLPPTMANFGRELQAEEAVYEGATADHPPGYRLRNVSSPPQVHALPDVQLGDQIVIFTPRDHSWLRENECFLVSRVDVQQLAAGDGWRRYASTLELIHMLHGGSWDYGADVRVTVHSRLVQPILDMLLFFMGLPVVLARRIGNVFVAIGQCVLIVSSFLLLVLTCQSLGTHYLLPPALASWCPILIFTPIAWWNIVGTFGKRG